LNGQWESSGWDRQTMTDTNNAIDLARHWLTGAIFVGFRFDSNFTLFFYCERETSFLGSALPRQIELNILEEWWMGDRQDWEEKISCYGVGVEPDEPVKAFELARLRWTGNSSISDLSLDMNGMRIRFENGVIIQTLLTGEDEFCFSISEFGIAEEHSKWSVTCDVAGLHVRTP
jgi:hypothetical protein